MYANKKYDNPNPRLTANYLSRLVFWWLKPLFSYGRRHDLEVKDVYNVLPDDVSEILGNKLEEHWLEELRAAKEDGRKAKLYAALKKTFLWSFAHYGGWILFLCVVLRVVQPYTLGLLIWHFDPRANSSPAEAYMYATGVVVLAAMIALINHHTCLGLMEIGMRVRIACSSLVYRKILRLSRSSSSSTTSGQIVNLLSNDVARFDQLFVLLHYIWIMPIQGALIAFFIWESVGIASLAGVFLITIQTIPAQGYISKLTSRLRLKIALRTDERVRLMSEIIGGIQVIKMYTWEKPFQKLVSFARSHEIDVLTMTSYLRGFTLATFVFTERTTLYFTIMAYVMLGNDISADKVFSIAQYFNILQATMAIFYPMAVSMAAEANVSIKRLQDFLLLNENAPIKRSLPADSEDTIVLKNVTASWAENTITNTLHDVSAYIRTGKLYALVGPVGSGKSSFLQLLLGELNPLDGTVHVGGSSSYASQEPWLFGGTVRNNILFGQPFDSKKYETVARVCALVKDFEQLPHGDKSFVGDRGASLSGGQRARINLARAVYRDADIYLLDDPLSAVDTHVGKHLFDECIVNYLRGKTRVLVTHQIQYLKNCDYIIMLNNGKVEKIGTFADFQKVQVDIENLLVKDEQKEETTITEVEENGKLNLTVSNNTEEDDDGENQEAEELVAKGDMSKALYWKYFRAGGSLFMIFSFVVAMIAGQIGSSGSDYWVAYWTNQEEIRIKAISNQTVVSKMNVLETNSTEGHVELYNNVISDTESLNFTRSVNMTKVEDNLRDTRYLDTDTALWIYGGFIIVSVIMTTTRNLLFFKICMNASKNLHNIMFSCILKAPMLFFNTHPAGRILNRFSKDVGSVDEILPRTMIESIQIFAVMTGILTQVIIINWWTIFPIFVMGLLYWIIRRIYISTAQDVKRLEGVTKSPVFSHVNSTFAGLTTIRSSAAGELVRKEFDLHQDLHTGAFSLTITTSTAFGFALDVVSIAFIAFVTYSFILMDDGNTFAGNVGLAISQILILCGMLQHGMRQTAESMAQMTSVERILQFTQLEEEGPFESEPGKKPLSSWPEKGEVKFDRVYLRYSDSEPPVLKNVNFLVMPGTKVGIVGRTGAGKSSLISALFNLAKLNGDIYIDGINIKKIGLHDLRSKISIIPQEPMLFSATLRDNLDPFHKYDDASVWSALEEVELKEAVRSLDQHVNQGGTNFSSGQRQLLCLARAIIRNNKILIMDEATANVDPNTDILIQSTIRKKFNDCTVLTIAHRLNTIMDNDKILVMDNGYAVEFDHPYKLLQNERGYLTSLVQEAGSVIMEEFKRISKETYARNVDQSL